MPNHGLDLFSEVKWFSSLLSFPTLVCAKLTGGCVTLGHEQGAFHNAAGAGLAQDCKTFNKCSFRIFNVSMNGRYKIAPESGHCERNGLQRDDGGGVQGQRGATRRRRTLCDCPTSSKAAEI